MTPRDYCPGVPDGSNPAHAFVAAEGRCHFCGVAGPASAWRLVHLMRHALGVRRVNGRWTKPYRNRFAASGDNVAAWEELARAGFASEHLDALSPFRLFHVTDRGREVALDGIGFKRRWGYGRPLHGDEA
jgi:hypothetical protein